MACFFNPQKKNTKLPTDCVEKTMRLGDHGNLQHQRLSQQPWFVSIYLLLTAVIQFVVTESYIQILIPPQTVNAPHIGIA